jgi:hypothetical protein
MLGKDKVLCKKDSVLNKHNLYYKRIFRCIRGRSKCLKGCFYLGITLIKTNYKGSHEMYNAHSYLGTDKIQTYKKIPVLGESGMF